MALARRYVMTVIENNEGKELMLDLSEVNTVMRDLVIDCDNMDEAEELVYLLLGKEEMKSKWLKFLDSFLCNIKGAELEVLLEKHAARLNKQLVGFSQI